MVRLGMTMVRLGMTQTPLGMTMVRLGMTMGGALGEAGTGVGEVAESEQQCCSRHVVGFPLRLPPFKKAHTVGRVSKEFPIRVRR
jgi:hypothetical protein